MDYTEVELMFGEEKIDAKYLEDKDKIKALLECNNIEGMIKKPDNYDNEDFNNNHKVAYYFLNVLSKFQDYYTLKDNETVTITTESVDDNVKQAINIGLFRLINSKGNPINYRTIPKYYATVYGEENIELDEEKIIEIQEDKKKKNVKIIKKINNSGIENPQDLLDKSERIRRNIVFLSNIIKKYGESYNYLESQIGNICPKLQKNISHGYQNSSKLTDYFWIDLAENGDADKRPISISVFFRSDDSNEPALEVAIELNDGKVDQDEKDISTPLYKKKYDALVDRVRNDPEKYKGLKYYMVSCDKNTRASKTVLPLDVYDEDKPFDINSSKIKANERIKFAIVIDIEDPEIAKDTSTILDSIKDGIETLLPLYLGEHDIGPVESKIDSALKNSDKKQVILTGAPGTGKTFGAEKYAELMCTVDGKLDSHRVKRIQFHPSYDYTDFVEGIRPVNIGASDSDKTMSFVKMDGEFKAFCRSAVEDSLSMLVPNIDILREVRELVDSVNVDKTAIESIINTINEVNNEITKKNEKGDNSFSEELAGTIKTLGAIEGSDGAAKDKMKSGLADLSRKCEVLFEEEKRKIWNKLIDVDKKNEERRTDEEKVLLERFRNSEQKYYFIVDEINRADLSKVFGELMYSLEYRGLHNRMPTQYSQLNEVYKKFVDSETGKTEYKPLSFDCFEDGFFIPENVIIIGAMNDIDKSVDSFDFALRRRFQWIQIKANEVMRPVIVSMLKKKGYKVDEAKDQIDRLIDSIEKMNTTLLNEGKNFGITEDYHIGPALFKDYELEMDGDTPADIVNIASLQSIFDANISLTIKEYVRGRGNEALRIVKSCGGALGVKVDNN